MSDPQVICSWALNSAGLDMQLKPATQLSAAWKADLPPLELHEACWFRHAVAHCAGEAGPGLPAEDPSHPRTKLHVSSHVASFPPMI